MPVSTRKKNASVHPGHVVMSGQKPRRTGQQIEADKARAKAAAEVAKAQAKSKHHATLARIAQLEDAQEEEEAAYSTRPDLLEVPSDLDDTHMDSELEDRVSRNSGSDDDTESRGVTTPADSDSDDTSSNNKRNAERESRSLRAQVQDLRSILRTKGSSSSRKRDAAIPDIRVVPNKRLRRCNATEGLRQGWRTQIPSQGPSQHAATSVRDHDDNLDSESLSSVPLASTRMRTLPSATEGEGISSSSGSRLGRRTDETGIRFRPLSLPRENMPLSSSTSSATGSSWTGDIIREPKRVSGNQKVKYRLDDLPCGPGGLRSWQREFTPRLLAWAGSLPDPFSANRHLHNEIVKIWERVYPMSQLEREDILLIERNAYNALNNWRSDMGKMGHKVVCELFESDTIAYGTAENRKGYVSDALDQLQYVYKHPDRTGGSRGAFCSTLISKVYAYHEKKITAGACEYGVQIGGLALATAAVERGLTLFCDGNDALETLERGHAFTDDPWGKVTRKLVETTKKLQDSHWEVIINECSVHIRGGLPTLDTSQDLGSDDERNPYARIEIDW